MSKRTIRILAVLGLVAVLLLAWWQGRGAPTASTPAGTATSTAASRSAAPSQSPTGTPGTSASALPSGPASALPASAGASSPAASARPSGCSAARGPIIPTRITLGSVATDSPVLSLGLADDGSVETPPFDQPMSVGWYNKGPRPGDARGKVVLTAHTFHRGGGLGNALHDEQHGLRPGDLIKVSDAQGNTLCYRHTTALKVAVADYDPASTVLYDAHGAPMLAIVICWDHVRGTNSWDSRIIYYAEPV